MSGAAAAPRAAAALVLWLTRPAPRAPAGACSTIAASPRSPITTCGARWRRSRCGAPTRGSAGSPSTSPTTGPERCGAPAGRAVPGLRDCCVDEATVAASSLGAHDHCEHNVEDVLGRFVDVSWAYRFGPPAQDLSCSAWNARRDGDRVALTGFSIPDRTTLRRGERAPPRRQRHARRGDRPAQRSVRTFAARLLHGCRILIPGFEPADDGFSLEPGTRPRHRAAPHRRRRRAAARRAHRREPRRTGRAHSPEPAA